MQLQYLNQSLQQKLRSVLITDQFPISHRSIKLVIALRYHGAVKVFYGIRCFRCQFYAYLNNAIDLNIKLYFHRISVISNKWSSILHDKTTVRSVSGNRLSFCQRSISWLRASVQGLYIEWVTPKIEQFVSYAIPTKNFLTYLQMF